MKKGTLVFLFFVAAILLAPTESAMAADTQSTPPANTTVAAVTKEESPRLVPYVDYSGDLANRPALTGDWRGWRQILMDKGVRADLSMTLTYQKNTSGGKRYEESYQSNLSYGLQFDTEKMGLWPGGLLTVRGMSRFGASNNANTGAYLPVNTASLYPVPEEDLSALTDFNYMQFLSPQVALLVGKVSLRETVGFAHDETTQFMNAGFNFNPVVATTFPLTAEAAGLILYPTKDINLTTLVLDSEGSANHCGFPEAFERGTTVFQNLEVGINPWGLPGHQRVGWTWSDKSRIQFSQSRLTLFETVITGNTNLLKRKSNDWSFFYNFDQYLYTVPGSKDRGFGLFGRYGVTDGEVNPTSSFYSIGLGGKGMWEARPNDTFGVGYYYLDATDNLPSALQRRVDDEQGIELFYNIEVTRSLHVTPDLQFINPLQNGVDNVVVAGVRVKVDF